MRDVGARKLSDEANSSLSGGFTVSSGIRKLRPPSRCVHGRYRGDPHLGSGLDPTPCQFRRWLVPIESTSQSWSQYYRRLQELNHNQNAENQQRSCARFYHFTTTDNRIIHEVEYQSLPSFIKAILPAPLPSPLPIVSPITPTPAPPAPAQP